MAIQPMAIDEDNGWLKFEDDNVQTMTYELELEP